MSVATNKTELSQKVEAELFGEYDVMVPGPAASLTAVGAGKTEADGGVQERTGRPLIINLDLLSYHARQKALSASAHVSLSHVFYLVSVLCGRRRSRLHALQSGSSLRCWIFFDYLLGKGLTLDAVE